MPDVEPLRFPSREGGPGQQASDDAVTVAVVAGTGAVATAGYAAVRGGNASADVAASADADDDASADINTYQADLRAVCSGRRRRRRRPRVQSTSALLNSPSPCFTNAVYHIQELKKTAENWCQQSGKYPPQINQDKHQYSKPLRSQSKDLDAESVTSTELFVEGIAISARESCPLPPLLKKRNDVLEEVVHMVERMEADRQHAAEALAKEKRTKRLLENEMDSILRRKQQKHSFAVQKEHEAGRRGSTKLRLQLKLERNKLDQAQEQLSHTEVLNQSLHDDINFAKKQIPIVKENLELQRGIIKQVNAAQAEADEVHSKTQSNFILVDKEKKKMELDTNNEMTSLARDLLVTKNQLANKLDDFNQLKMLEESIQAEIKEAEKTIALTEEKCAATARRIPELMELEETEKDRIVQFKLQIENGMRKNKKLKEKLIALQEKSEKTRLHGEAEVSCLEEQLLSKRNAFAALCTENIEYEQNVADYKMKISESEKAVKQMQEERKQMLQKIIDNDEQWKKAKEEVTQVVAQHSVTQTKLEEQEQLTFMEEQRARKEIENLRNDLTGQMTALELLKGQCADKNEELYRHQRISALANKKLQKEFEEASTATEELETKVVKIKTLTEHFEKIQSEHQNTLVNLEKEKKLQCDHLKAAQDLHAAAVERYDTTLGRISDLTKKSEEYRAASDRMEKNVENMPEVIEELESVFDAVEFKNKSAALIMSTLQSDINNCKQRAQRSKQRLTAHVTRRKKTLEDTEAALTLALKDNDRLASEYEGLRKSLMEAKQEAVSALSEKNHAQRSFHYYTQLSLLQKRMHKALVKYFEQRSLYSQAELDRCQALSQETEQKIKAAQEELSAETQLISAFLSLTDDSTTTDDAGVNKQASPGSNE